MKEFPSVPPDASAALYFLPGQYLFANFQEEMTSIKALSSEQVARAFRGVHTDTGWLGRRVLRYREASEGNAVISYEPAGTQSILVVLPSGEIERLDVPLPTLVLLGKGTDYYLWAASSGYVTSKTKLAVAPLPNIGSGKICFGKNEVPETHPSTLRAVWKLIFESPFNADHSSNRCTTEQSDVRIFGILIDVHNKPKIRFRCGVYDHLIQIPFSWIGKLPEGIVDLNEIESLLQMMLP